MEEFGLGLVLQVPAVKAVLLTVGVYVAAMLTLAMTLHSFATGVLRPIARLTTSTKKDDRYVELVIWWSDSVADVLRFWSLGEWVFGWQRSKRMLEDRGKPLGKRRWE